MYFIVFIYMQFIYIRFCVLKLVSVFTFVRNIFINLTNLGIPYALRRRKYVNASEKHV